MGTKQIDLGTEVIKGLYRSLGLRGLAIVLNNAFAHGEIITERVGYCDDQVLALVFEGIEKFEAASADWDES